MRPITYVMTYRGVEGFRQGIHNGNSRDVLIAGDEIPGLETALVTKPLQGGGRIRGEEVIGGTDYASAEDAEHAYRNAAEHMQHFMDRIDRIYVYLGAQGAGPGFQWVREMLAREPRPGISLVACDCDKQKKTDFAASNGLGIIWADCGGRKTLARIVNETLRI